MTDTEQREAARQFINKWKKGGDEKQDCHSFWIELLHDVLGVESPTSYIRFEKPVKLPEEDGKVHTRYIDGYIADVHVLIEQKGSKHSLDEKELQSGGKMFTPYEQAKRYDNNLPKSEKANWIVTCNFTEIWVYNMDTPVPEPEKIKLLELQDKYKKLDFLVKKDVKEISHEMEVSIKAGSIIGLIYDAFMKQYGITEKAPPNETAEDMAKREHKLRSLNALCVRLVFLFYAEDAGIFERDQFHDYMRPFSVRESRRALIELFKVLDTPLLERDDYLEEDLAAFPYVNGGLFADESVEVPQFNEDLRKLLLEDASEGFDWRDISPTIFGAVFESTLNPETRRSGGMHYTSIENIHKVIDPLFLDELKEEFEKIRAIAVPKTKNKHLESFQDKLASLTFLDPAAGSGNFLTESYLSLRRLENEVIRELTGGQITLGTEQYNPIKVSIQQFYGIEINDFAVTVAKTALWIAESQMLEETKAILYGFNDDFLPLKSYVNITGGNALRIDWNDIVPKEKLSYIMGNPPFVANTGRISAEDSHSKKMISDSQAEDRNVLFGKNGGLLDYVACWYKKAALFIKDTSITCAFVSTDSITQGQQVEPLWGDLFKLGIVINFAYKSFKWKNDTNEKGATVFVVIIGFSYITKDCYLYQENEKKQASFINAYLLDAPNIIVKKRTKPICHVHSMQSGGKPVEGGFLIFSDSEKEQFIMKEPGSEKYFRRFTSGESFINGKVQWCLWMKDITPHELSGMPLVKERIKKVQEFRLSSKKAATRKAANTPHLFMEIKQPEDNYLLIPLTTSRNRRYIPIGFVSPDVIANNGASFVPSATIYDFGVLTSNVHMAWMRAVCGYFGPSYRYSNKIVYNTFPWPTPTDAQKRKIEQAAQGILKARALYPDSSLADLYDPLTMPPELRKAHMDNDRAVMTAYGFSTKMTESECVAELMKMYQNLVEES